MPPRPSRSSTPKLSYTPVNDVATHRDLLLFEERLKGNAQILKKRKTRYQFFLLCLCMVIFVAASDVILDTYILMKPCNWALSKIPPKYGGPWSPITPHPYVAPGTLLVAGTTMFLFFSNGLYSEKIGYANRYVSHANRTLRSFNMYLNVRPRPMSSNWFLRMLRSSSSPNPPLNYGHSSQPSTPRDLSPGSPRSPSASRGGGAPITPIPPPKNPRGELIFNSRVDKGFREGYERYRMAYERKREDLQREALEKRAARSWWAWLFLRGQRIIGKEKEGSPAAAAVPEGAGPLRRGRSVRTPTGSRKNSPAAGGASRRRSANLESVPERKPLDGELRLRRTPTPSTITTQPGDESDASTTPSIPDREGTPGGGGSRLMRKRDRARTESFSFLLGKPGSAMDD